MKILCIETARLPPEWTRSTCALSVPFFDRVSAADIRWVERPLAEGDPAFRQIIPYTVIEKDGKLLCYPRRGAETRLHGLWSCGAGGHIDEGDARPTLEGAVRAGMLRELSEELRGFSAERARFEYRGVINETETPVSRVHLGLVYLMRCPADCRPAPADELRGAAWLAPEELAQLREEGWSRLARRLLAAAALPAPLVSVLPPPAA